MQVYFLDNDDFFNRKEVLSQKDGSPFEDATERMVFFCKGVIETVKKFGWAPDIVHCHGWMTSLIPLYLKTAYDNEPIFQNAKTIYSIYNSDLAYNLPVDNFVEIASINNLTESDLDAYLEDDKLTLFKGASTFADGIINVPVEKGDEGLEFLNETDKPLIKHEEEAYKPAYMDFYQTFL